MTFDKLLTLALEAKNFDLRLIGNQEGPKGMPSQSPIRGLDFFKREDETSRKFYDPRGLGADVLQGVVKSRPVKENEEIVYNGIMLALSDPEQKVILEGVLAKYLHVYQELESALRQQKRVGEELERARKSHEREMNQPYEKRSPEVLKRLVDKIDDFEKEFDGYETIINKNSKELEKEEPQELYDDNDEYQLPELGHIYTTVYNCIIASATKIIEKIKASLPGNQRKDPEAITLAIKTKYQTASNNVFGAIVAYRSNHGVKGKQALIKFKENILSKRHEAKSGLSRRFMLFDPVLALGYVLRYVASTAVIINVHTNTPTISLMGQSVYKQPTDPKIEQVVAIIKQDKSRRDQKTLLKAMEKLTKIDGTGEAQDMFDRYIRGNMGITEADVIRAIRASEPQQ